ncbi:SAM-dependent methyltransferase [Vibrio vulnificus]|nr:SAM-dependent methyltransferase [Vibrio vulnificus]
MDDSSATWRQYYEKSLLRPHNSRTEIAIELNQSGLKPLSIAVVEREVR